MPGFHRITSTVVVYIYFRSNCFYSLISTFISARNILDLPDCRRGHITEDVELSTDDMKITNRNHSRTLIECLGGCWLQIPFNCSSVVRDDQGKPL